MLSLVYFWIDLLLAHSILLLLLCLFARVLCVYGCARVHKCSWYLCKYSKSYHKISIHCLDAREYATKVEDSTYKHRYAPQASKHTHTLKERGEKETHTNTLTFISKKKNKRSTQNTGLYFYLSFSLTSSFRYENRFVGLFRFFFLILRPNRHRFHSIRLHDHYDDVDYLQPRTIDHHFVFHLNNFLMRLAHRDFNTSSNLCAMRCYSCCCSLFFLTNLLRTM